MTAPDPTAPEPGEPTLAALCDTVREALAKATPGPWQCWNGWGPPAGAMADERAMTRIGPAGDYWGGVRGFAGIPGKTDGDLYARKADAELVAQAPTWLARLVEGVRKMEKEIERLRDYRRWLTEALQEANETKRDVMAEVTALQAKLRDQSEREADTLAKDRIKTAEINILTQENRALQAKLADAERDSLSKFEDWMKSRPGASWIATMKDVATYRDGEAIARPDGQPALVWTLPQFQRLALSAPPGTTRESTEEGSE